MSAIGPAPIPLSGGWIGVSIEAGSISLPPGIATSANQVTEIASLASIDAGVASVDAGVAALGAQLPAALSGGWLGVSIEAGSISLPPGIATSANQTTEIASLASIDAGVAALVQAGQLPAALVGGRLDVNVGASALPAGAASEATLATLATEATVGTLATEATLGTRASEATLAGVLTTSAFQARVASLGQKTMAGSMPVVLASDQSAIPVTGPLTDAELRAVAVPVSGPLTDAQLRAVAVPVSGPLTDAQLRAAAVVVGDGGGSLTVDGSVSLTGSLPAGSSTIGLVSQGAAGASAWLVDGSAVTQPVSAAALPLPTGAATETTLGTRAAASQLPGALVGSRLDVNIGAWMSSTTPSVGQKAMTASIPVAIASNQSALPVTDNAGSLTVDSAQLPTVLGAQANGGSLSIVFGTGTNFVAAPGGTVPAQAAFIGGRNGPGGTIEAPGVYDLNTGAGIDWVLGASLRKSVGAGTSVELGTATDPIRTDPTGTTSQPVGDGGGSLTVDSAQLPTSLVSGRLDVNIGAQSAAALTVSGTVAVTDGGGSLTVDTPQLPSSLGQKTSAASVSVTLSSDDDFIGDVGIAVPGKAAFIAARDNVGSTMQVPGVYDLNTGAGVDWVLGASLRKSTGAGASVELGTSTDPMRVDPTGTTSQPVGDGGGSLTVDAPVGTPVFARLSDGAAALIGQKAMASSLPVVMASDQSALPVTAPTLTKGTQGAQGFSTQDLKDSGRVLKTYTVSALATVTSEALISLTPYADLTAGSAATTFAVTSGKRLRIQSIVVTVRTTSTVNVGGIVRFRMLAGTVLVGSPVHASLGCMGSNLATAVAGNSQSFALTFPDGLELSGTMQFGLTQLFSATSAAIDVHVVGYEY